MGCHPVGELELVGMREPIDYYMEHELEEERAYQRWLKKRPICDWCLEPIEEDYAYRIGDELVCEHCIEDCRERVYEKEI